MPIRGRAIEKEAPGLCGTIGAAKQAQSDGAAGPRGGGKGRDPKARPAPGRRPFRRRWPFLAGLALLALAAAAPALAQEPPPAANTTGASGLPLPRFVSLKTDRVNLRSGPGTDYPTVWVYTRAGLPVEITNEFEGWRQVRDSQGTAGWVLASLVSGRRTVLVLPWEAKPDAPPPRVPLFVSDSARARQVAEVEAGVIANVHACDSRWCSVTIDAYRGYIEQAKLWGVYQNEVVK